VSSSSRDNLADRHLAVLQGYADGLTTEEVAKRLGYAHKTVWDVSMQARRTLGAATTTQAVVLAMSLGLIEVEHGQGMRLRRVREHAASIVSLLGTS
jgi:DNA-binding NarL/FixJ family response regulator